MGCVYEEHSGYIPPFLEGFRIRFFLKYNPMYDSQKFFSVVKNSPTEVDPKLMDEFMMKLLFPPKEIVEKWVLM